MDVISAKTTINLCRMIKEEVNDRSIITAN